MGKINKYDHIYDKDGNLIRHVGDDGKLKNYTTEELEQLLDKLAEDKDENGNVKDPQALNNVNAMLFRYYQKYGPSKSLLDKLNTYKKTDTEQVTKVLEDVDTEMKTLSEEDQKALYDDMRSFEDSEQLVERETDYEPEQYVQFEELPDKEAA